MDWSADPLFLSTRIAMPTVEIGLVALALSFVAATVIPSVAVYVLLALYTERKLEAHESDEQGHWEEIARRLETLEDYPDPPPTETDASSLDSHTSKFAGVLARDPPRNPRTVVGEDETIYIAPPCSYIAFRGESAVEPDAVVFGFQVDPSRDVPPAWMRAFRDAIEEGRVECRETSPGQESGPPTDPASAVRKDPDEAIRQK